MRFRGPFSCRSIGFPFVRDVLVDSLSAHILPMLPVMGCLSDAQVSHLNLHRSYRGEYCCFIVAQFCSIITIFASCGASKSAQKLVQSCKL